MAVTCYSFPNVNPNHRGPFRLLFCWQQPVYKSFSLQVWEDVWWCFVPKCMITHSTCRAEFLFKVNHGSISQNNTFFNEKVHLLLSSRIKIHQHICFDNCFELCLIVHISHLIQTRWLFHWRIDDFKKNLKSSFSRVDYLWFIVMFSFSRSHGTHSLQRIHWWASDILLLMKKQIHLHLGWPKGEHFFSKLKFLGELFL